MRPSRRWQSGLWCVALSLAAQFASAINIQIDYTYDTGNFFGANNPQGPTAGAQAKAALEAVASYYSTILTDSFSLIQTPATLHSSVSTGVWTWHWSESFKDPTTNGDVVVNDPTVAANQYIVYVGARSLPAAIAGLGGPGGSGFSSTPTGLFSPAEGNQGNATTATFQNQVFLRGQSSGFARWGGTISFDNDGSTDWFFNHLGTPSGNVADFYSVALHELAHTLGFGETTQGSVWNTFVNINNSTFIGVNAENQVGGNAVPLSSGLDHWAANTKSVVYGASIQQEALMDPDLTNGTRKKVTALDAAALQDIGWSLGPPPTPPAVNGDYNNNGVVDASDYAIWRKRLNQNVTLPNDNGLGAPIGQSHYTLWRSNFGKVASGSGSGSLLATGEVPEPASGLLATLLAICVYFNRRTLRR